MKTCGKCKQARELEYFSKDRKNKDGLDNRCKDCRASGVSRNKKMLRGAALRAKKSGIEFNIDLEDVVIPKNCPLLGMELRTEFGGINKCVPNSATLDRIDNNLGYVKGNVWVVSHKANTIMSYATADEIIAVGEGLKKKQEELNKTIKQLDLLKAVV